MELFEDITKTARILIVDDQEASSRVLAHIIEAAGFAICTTISDPELALNQFGQIKPDLILLDLHMEPLSGVQVMERLNSILLPGERPPVLVLTGDTSAAAKHDALGAGASDFLLKPFDPAEVLLRIKHMLAARALFLRCQVYSHGLERLVDRRTAELQRRTHDLEKTIRELQETQHQVIQQERIRALGTMASGIAHDLNNGLTLILGYGDILLADETKFPTGSKERLCMQHIVDAGNDSAKMVKRLRDFYRPSDTREERQPVDLNGLICQAISLTSPKWQCEAEASGRQIRILADTGEIPVIAGAPAELREVLTNLIFNAIDAMPKGGTITFRTSQRHGFIRLEICDTGIGMTEDTRLRCLEPFYTTKGSGGSGLGLAMSYGIIRRHGGTIGIESRLNHGSTFILLFPVPDLPFTPHVADSAASVQPLRVLVVDDHEGIREIVSAYLAEDRHIVETASNAREALEKFQRSDFDLIITDRAMPEISGDELAASIKKLNPSEPIIMLTGFADLITEPNTNVDLLVSKPARLDDLRLAIKQVMSRG